MALSWKQQYESGMLEEDSGYKDLFSGTNKPIQEVGKPFKPNDKFYLSYPLERAKAKSEDSFLIQCVKYLPPGPGQSLRFNLTDDAKSTLGNKINNKDAGLDKDNSGSIEKNEQIKFIDTNNSTLSGVGMDRRVNELKQKTRFYVELPIPKQVNDGNSCVWSGNSMNLFTLAGLDLASGLMQKPGETLGMVQNIIDSFLKGGNFEDLGLGDGEEMQNAIRASLSGLAINQFGGNTTPNSVMSRGMGKILNSNKELLFDGVNLREFKFDFTFTPRSKAEGERAMNIIRSLKMAMAPKKGEDNSGSSGGILINSPDLFLLEYRSGGVTHPFLNSFKPCALTSLSVNYTGTGTYSTYADGSVPVHMKVAMSFKETNPIYEEDYKGVGGVGF
tara:strand:- start:886 stop:2049 length:1164 start_codon:yes stop_codon:yes gene_type:complete